MRVSTHMFNKNTMDMLNSKTYKQYMKKNPAEKTENKPTEGTVNITDSIKVVKTDSKIAVVHTTDSKEEKVLSEHDLKSSAGLKLDAQFFSKLPTLSKTDEDRIREINNRINSTSLANYL